VKKPDMRRCLSSVSIIDQNIESRNQRKNDSKYHFFSARLTVDDRENALLLVHLSLRTFALSIFESKVKVKEINLEAVEEASWQTYMNQQRRRMQVHIFNSRYMETGVVMSPNRRAVVHSVSVTDK
jgi:hypothetical protein